MAVRCGNCTYAFKGNLYILQCSLIQSSIIVYMYAQLFLQDGLIDTATIMKYIFD